MREASRKDVTTSVEDPFCVQSCLTNVKGWEFSEEVHQETFERQEELASREDGGIITEVRGKSLTW